MKDIMSKFQENILSGLHGIANEYVVFAIAWHVVFYALIIALLARWQPSYRLLGTMMLLPLLSVSVLAWITGNPFNGLLFSAAAILLLFFGLKAPDQTIVMSRLPFAIAGIVMVVFGLLYPHFLETQSPLTYLYASPTGLVPCPTLSVVIGLALLFNGFGSKALSIVLLSYGLFYGLFGVIVLSVYLDIGLIIGSAALLLQLVRN